MDKEKVTEELVRQNGNQAAAVMADYAGQGGGGGGTSGIPTIDKNTQPNIVWREPTAEDLAKFQSVGITKVADLPEGKLPLFWVTKSLVVDVEYVVSVEPSSEGDTQVTVAVNKDASFFLTDDWLLLGSVSPK